MSYTKEKNSIEAANKKWLEGGESKRNKPNPRVNNILNMKATYKVRTPKCWSVVRG